MNCENKPNILLISQSLVGGGAEKVVSNLSISFKEYANVYIVTYKQDSDEYDFYGTRINLDCFGGNVSLFRKIKNFVYRIKSIRSIKKKYSIDYTISFLPHTDYANVFSKIKKEKTIIEVSSNSSAVFKGMKKFFRKMVLRRADKIVTVSKGSMYDLIRNFNIKKEKIITIYNSCAITKIGELRQEKLDLGFELPKKYIVAIGSFRKPKGHWHLIKAFSLFARKNHDYSLIILGDGEYRKDYNKLIECLGLRNNEVILPGFLINPYPVISKSDLFIFTSVYEGFGNVIVEAMACGTPVLSVDCDYGPREIISPNSDVLYRTNFLESGEFGWISPRIKNDNPDFSLNIEEDDYILSDSIEKVIGNSAKRNQFKKLGLERCKFFDNVQFYKKWLDLIKNEM